MDAQRVPPSAWMTSQSMVIWRSPSASRSTTAADQTLDLARTAVQLERLDVALFARIGRARQHRVLRRDPAEALALEEGRNLFLDRSGADDPGVAHFSQHRTLRIHGKSGRQLDRAHFVLRSSVRSCHSCSAPSSSFSPSPALPAAGWPRGMPRGRSRSDRRCPRRRRRA